MRKASIRELREHTGELVRATAEGKILITERGRPVALLKAIEAADLTGKPFPKRDLRSMQKISVDSTDYIAADREGR